MCARLQPPLTLIACGALDLGSVSGSVNGGAHPAGDLGAAHPGPGALAQFHNAQGVYDSVTSRMPLPALRARTLERETCWAIVNQLLTAQGVGGARGGVRESHAKAVALR